MDRMLRFGKNHRRMFRPVNDIYESSEEPITPELDNKYDLWAIAKTGNVKIFEEHKEAIIARAARLHASDIARKKQNMRGSCSTLDNTPSSLLSACPCDVDKDLEDVALDQHAWECYTCSNNMKGKTIACSWCARKCHAGHNLQLTESKLKTCKCGVDKHIVNIGDLLDNPLNFTDSVRVFVYECFYE